MNRMIDLRSDTAIQPTETMLTAVRSLQFGDNLLGEDEPTSALIEKAGSLTGMEDGILTPSGTMSNQIAIAALTRPGDEVVLGPESHVRNLEGAGLAANSGVQIRCVPVDHGTYDIDALESAIRSATLQEAPTGLISLEATYDLNSGYVTPLDNYRDIRRIADKHGIPIFLDGARIFNSAVALGIELREICQYVDAVQFCLNKGLGAPLGSILLGSANVMEQARRVRQRLGGGMRHTGWLAAPALVAFDDWRRTIESDHVQANHLADRLAAIDHLTVNNEPVHSNIVNLTIDPQVMTVERFIDSLIARGVYVKRIGDDSVRLVTHRSASAHDLEHVCKAFEQVLTG